MYVAILAGGLALILALLQLFRERIPRINVALDEGIQGSHTSLRVTFISKH